MTETTVQAVYDWLNALAPFDSAEDFDNAGLLMGDPGARVRNVLFALDATPEAAREATAIGVELLITHHPLLFSPLRRIDYASPQGRTIAALAGSRIALLSAHTNWDKAEGGVSDALADALCLQNAFRVDGYFRLGELPAPMDGAALRALITERLHAAPRVYGSASRPIVRVAVAGGSCGEGVAKALALGAEAIVVGEIKHHELLNACGRGLTVLEAGHYATEAPGIRALYQRFSSDAASAGWQVGARLYDTAPYAGATLTGM